MKYRTRTYYSDGQKALMWEPWKEGYTLHQIAGLFDRAHTSVQGILSRTGGVRPPARSRCATALTLAEIEEISRATVDGQSIRSVAARLGRSPSTVSREIKRNGGQSDYRATEADSAAWDRALRPKPCKLVENSGYEAVRLPAFLHVPYRFKTASIGPPASNASIHLLFFAFSPATHRVDQHRLPPRVHPIGYGRSARSQAVQSASVAQ
jgi:DNA-binding CsgD family transcriptional regulator